MHKLKSHRPSNALLKQLLDVPSGPKWSFLFFSVRCLCYRKNIFMLSVRVYMRPLLYLMPRLNDFRIFSRTPKGAKYILVFLLRPFTRFKHKFKNLSSSKCFPELYIFTLWIKIPPQFECLRAALLLA